MRLRVYISFVTSRASRVVRNRHGDGVRFQRYKKPGATMTNHAAAWARMRSIWEEPVPVIYLTLLYNVEWAINSASVDQIHQAKVNVSSKERFRQTTRCQSRWLLNQVANTETFRRTTRYRGYRLTLDKTFSDIVFLNVFSSESYSLTSNFSS